MNEWIPQLNQWSATWWTWTFHATWQAALVGAALLAVTRVGRRWPAPVRHAVLLLALAKFAMPPVTGIPAGFFGQFSLPPGSSPAPLPAITTQVEPARESTPLAPATPLLSATAAESPMPREQTVRVPCPVSPTRPVKLSWQALLMLAQATGCLVVTAWILRQFILLRENATRAKTVNEGPLLELMRLSARQLGLRRVPRLLLSNEATTPFAFGVWRPRVMLPRPAAEHLDMEELRTILAHELAHIRRGDLWINWGQLLLLAVWWFNPVLWVLNRAIRQAREDCCDDLLLARAVTSNDAYCDVLLRAAAELAGKDRAPVALGLTTPLHPLGHRLARIADKTLSRLPRLPLAGALVITLLGCLLLPGLRSQEATAPVVPPTIAAPPHGSPEPAPARHELNARRRQYMAEARTNTVEQLFGAIVLEKFFEDQRQRILWQELVGRGAPAAKFLGRQLRIASPKKPGAPDSRRVQSARMLGEMGTNALVALPDLIATLEDDEDNLRTTVALALGEIGPAAKAAIPALIEAIHFKTRFAPNALPKLGPESAEILTTLLKTLKDQSMPSDLRAGAVSGLALMKIGWPAIETALVNGLRDADPHVARTCAFVLRDSTRTRSPEMIQTLEAFRRTNPRPELDPDDFPTPAEIPKLLEQLHAACESPDQMKYHIEGGRILMQLGQMGADAAPAVPTLIQLLSRPDNSLSLSVAYALRQIGPAAAAAVPALLTRLKAPTTRDYFTIISTLGGIGPAAGDAVPVILAIWKTGQPAGIEPNCVRALGLIGPTAIPAAPAILELLEDEEAGLRLLAADALWRIDRSHDDKVAQVLVALLGQRLASWERSDGYILKILAEMGTRAQAAGPTVAVIAADRSHPEYHQALGTLGRIRPANAAASVRTLLADLERPESMQSRGDIIQALGHMGASAGPAIPALEKLAASEAGHAGQIVRGSLRKIRADLASQSPAKANTVPGDEKLR